MNLGKSYQPFLNVRPKHFNNRKRKPGQHLFNVSVDVTRKRYLLLCKAKGLIKDSESINYVFADGNFSLGIEFQNGVFKNFNDENELHCFINNWIIRSSHWHRDTLLKIVALEVVFTQNISLNMLWSSYKLL